MNHDVILSGGGCRLRPVTLADAQFIVDLRSRPHARGNIGDTVPTTVEQECWLERYLARDDDYYWIVEDERAGEASVGTYGLYDIADRVGVPGRWVMLPHANFLAAIPTLLIYRFAFEDLNLSKLVFNVVATNKRVLAFHRLMNAKETHRSSDAQRIAGRMVDFVWFEVNADDWPEMDQYWSQLTRFRENLGSDELA